MTPAQIVNRLLEYGSSEEYSQRPGGASDPWRQTTGRLKDMDFAPRPPGLGAEPGSEALPPQDDALDMLLDKPQDISIRPASKRPMRPPVNPRFRWRPPPEPPIGP